MKKRTLSLLLLVMLLVSLLPAAPASAAQARYAHIQSCSSTLSRSGSTLICYGSAQASNNSHLVYVHVSLLRCAHDGGNWSFVTSWGSNGVGRAGASVYQTPTAESGYDYYAHTVVQIRDPETNQLLESAGLDSDIISYPRT